MGRLKTCKAPDCTVRKPREELLGPMKEFCSVGCGYALARHRKHQKWAREAKEFRAKERTRRRVGREGSGPARQARDAVHAFVHLRDANKPCIVHGWACPNSEFDAGHFLSRGSHPELQYNTWNIHKQCRQSNQGAHNRKKYRNGIAGMYEANLVARIGQARVNWLKGPHGPKQYRTKDLKRIARIFRKRTALYRRIRASAHNQIDLLEATP